MISLTEKNTSISFSFIVQLDVSIFIHVKLNPVHLTFLTAIIICTLMFLGALGNLQIGRRFEDDCILKDLQQWPWIFGSQGTSLALSSLTPTWELSKIIICCVELVLMMDGVEIENLWGFVRDSDSMLILDAAEESSDTDEVVTVLDEVFDEEFQLLLSCKSFVKMSIILLIPIKYPSSWFPTVHSLLWSITTCSGSSTVFAKSINQILALFRSWTKSRELPITSWEWKNSEQSSVALIAFSRWMYFVWGSRID